jgi:RimJ/RimL family protein N-acetyltransferase
VLPRMAASAPELFRRLVHVSTIAPDPGADVIEMSARRMTDDRSEAVNRSFFDEAMPAAERFGLKFCNDMNPAQASQFLAKLGHDNWPRSSYEELRHPQCASGQLCAVPARCSSDATLAGTLRRALRCDFVAQDRRGPSGDEQSSAGTGGDLAGGSKYLMQFENLRCELIAGEVRLIPLSDCHIEPLRAACIEDPDIWQIYPHSMLGEHFDPAIAGRKAMPGVIFAACLGGDVVGITSYLRPDSVNKVVEIGGTYIAPRVRGTSYNRTMKKLLIEHAFAQGYNRIAFLVDERNLRSQAAVLKLGAMREGLLRAEEWHG